MTTANDAPEALRACLACFPYLPSRDTGRGHDRYAYELAQNLTDATLHVQVVEQGYASGVAAAGAKLARLLRDLARAKADVFHAVSPLGGAVIALLGRRPLVVTIHDVIAFHVAGFDHSWKLALVRACTRLCVARAAAVIVPYEVTRQELATLLGVSGDKVHVVNYGVDHHAYKPQPATPRSASRILYIGEVSRSKGVDVLLRAYQLVKRGAPEAELRVCGKPSRDRQRLEALCAELSLRDVTFGGFVPEQELATEYCSSAMMVFPSRVGFGLSTLEAMACGIPVVVAAALDAPEFIGDAGLLVPPDDPGALAGAMLRILREPGLAQTLAEKAASRAREFAWTRTASETRAVYRQVVEGEA